MQQEHQKAHHQKHLSSVGFWSCTKTDPLLEEASLKTPHRVQRGETVAFQCRYLKLRPKEFVMETVVCVCGYLTE